MKPLTIRVLAALAMVSLACAGLAQAQVFAQTQVSGPVQPSAQPQVSAQELPPPQPPAVENRPNTVRIDAGFGSAVGSIGLACSRALLANLEVEGGVGYGMSGVQLAGMVRGSFGSVTNRFVIAGGASAGLGTTQTLGGAVGWANAEVGFNHRGGAFTFHVAAGVTVGLSGRIQTCFLCDSGFVNVDLPGRVYPSLRVGYGYRF